MNDEKRSAVNSPGANRPHARSAPAGYDRQAVEHLLSVRRWENWNELLEWLRSEGSNDPELEPGELRALRQDAEQASERGAKFTRDSDLLWRELQGES